MPANQFADELKGTELLNCSLESLRDKIIGTSFDYERFLLIWTNYCKLLYLLIISSVGNWGIFMKLGSWNHKMGIWVSGNRSADKLKDTASLNCSVESSW